MKILRPKHAPRYVREEGITSFLLVSPRTCGAKLLTTTLVELAPGGSQRVHSHEPEQVYLILEGRGRMTVGSEEADVVAGECVFVPSGSPHGLRNTGPERLRYFSAAAPSFSREELERLWPLEPEEPPS
jgi:mannose-6-phosphate isomerase-like protein (cupin superfamily)